MARTRSLTLVIWCLVTAPCWAAPETDTTLSPADVASLEEVVVTARRVPGVHTSLKELPSHVTVVTADQIARSGARTTPEVLQQLAGVSVSDSRGFGLGTDAGANTRGVVNSSRTGALILVDGVRLNRLSGDEVHWLSVPVHTIERIEVLRGSGGTSYGEGALSGVINIITKRGADRPLVAEQGVEGGSYGWWRSVTGVRGTEGAWRYGASLSRQLTDGYRASTSSRATTSTLAVTWAPTPETTLDVTASHHEDTTRFPGGLTTATVERDRRNPGSFNGFFQDRISTVGATLTRRLDEAWTVVGNLYQRLWESDSTTTSAFANIAPSRGGGLRAAHQWQHPSWEATTVIGAELYEDKVTTGTRGAALSESNRDGGAVFIEETLKLFQRWILTAGFRYDRSDYEEALTFPVFEGTLLFNGRSPKVGVTYLANDVTTLYASWARTFKAPNIDDLDAVLPPYNDSPSVQPQTADTTELGVRWDAAPWARWQVAGYHTRIDDEILFNSDTFANANFTTRRVGAEVALHGALAKDRLTYAATYTLVKARFLKGAFTGYQIPGTPEHRITAKATYRFTPWLEGTADYLWVDTPFRINNFLNTLSGDIYGVVNATLRYRRPSHEIFLTVQNLLDEEYTSFQSSGGTDVSTGENPAPPRTWLLGAKFKT
ncbi:MAG: TonB-dependent receptor [Candidatus Omnitrophica bacterium]|nr:TonB-dependent receptor [Candidatus Omnitrophota bacterium]